MKREKLPPVGIPTTRMKKARGGSSTDGKSKGLVPQPGERVLARRSRSYKDRNYASWCAKMDARN